MSFNDNIRLDPSRVGTSGAGRKIAGAGGGSLLGVLLILHRHRSDEPPLDVFRHVVNLVVGG